VNDIHTHSALRQWRSQFLGPVPYVVLGSVATLLAILGPFGTGEVLSFVEAFIYWLVIAAGTYSIGFLVNAGLTPKLPTGWNKFSRIIVVSFVTGAAITPFVAVITYAAFDDPPLISEWLELTAEIFAIALIVNIILQVNDDRVKNLAVDHHQEGPTLLDRLPLEKRGPIIALSSQDHYTLVQTTRGEELVLIRLADAIREAEPTQGLQVHRSHWVALKQVSTARRDGGRAILTLSSEVEIPVSRSFIEAVKDTGLFAR
jgi:DNA-binding LytR/AlgR family response regulator